MTCPGALYDPDDMRTGSATAVDSGDAPRTFTVAGARNGLRDHLRSADPLIGLVGLVSLVVYVLHGFDKEMTRDLGVYAYGGQRFLEGEPPYVAILNRAGPLAHVVPGIGMGLGRLVGLSDVHGARVLYMLISVACLCLTYVVTRDLTRSRAAGVVAAVAFLGFQEFLDMATNGPREKTPMALFLMIALVAVQRRRWTTCGVFIALATLTWQPVFFAAILMAGVAVLLAPERRMRAGASVLLGGAVTSAIVLVYYALNNALGTFFECFVVINAEYTHQPNPFDNGYYIWLNLKSGFGPSLAVIAVGMLALVVLTVRSAPRAWRTRDVQAATWVAFGAGWLGGMVWSLIAFNASPDAFMLLPFAAIGVGGAVASLRTRVQPRVGLAVAVALALVLTAYATVFSVTTRGHYLAVETSAVTRTLRLGPHPSTVMSIRAPQALVMAHRKNPTRYQMFDADLERYINDTYQPGGLAGFADWVARDSPTYIVLQHGYRPPWLMPWLKGSYDNVGGPREFSIWVTRSVSQDVRRTMKHANEAARSGRQQ